VRLVIHVLLQAVTRRDRTPEYAVPPPHAASRLPAAPPRAGQAEHRTQDEQNRLATTEAFDTLGSSRFASARRGCTRLGCGQAFLLASWLQQRLVVVQAEHNRFRAALSCYNRTSSLRRVML
jgi:hypothetical protein